MNLYTQLCFNHTDEKQVHALCDVLDLNLTDGLRSELSSIPAIQVSPTKDIRMCDIMVHYLEHRLAAAKMAQQLAVALRRTA